MCSSALLLVACATVIGQPLQPDSLHYMRFDTPTPLALDASQIALLSSADPTALGQALAAADLRAELRPLPVAGWTLAPLVNPDAQPQQAIGAVSALAREPAAAFVSPVFRGADGGPIIITPTILVQFSKDAPIDVCRAAVEELHVGALDDRGWGGMPNTFRIRCDVRNGFAVLNAANALALRNDVIFAEPDMLFTGRAAAIFPNDPLFPDLWGLHNTGQAGGVPDMDMDIPEAWEMTQGSPSVPVLVIDTGVWLEHPDLNLLPGVDTTGQGVAGEAVNPCEQHGTWVAGTIAAIANNGFGVAGASPESPVISARTFIANIPATGCDGSWLTLSSWTVDTLDWAFTHGVRITNNSNFYGFTSAAIEAKYAQTRRDGMIHFASAGNFADPTPTYPASLPDVFAVSALTRTGALASFSNRGALVSAPGQGIVTTNRNEDGRRPTFVTVSGTSFASPYTAAVAALLLSQFFNLNADNIFNVFIDTSIDLGEPGFDTTFGAGFVNALAALEGARPPCRFDLVADQVVNASDMLKLFALWGDLYGPTDLLELLAEWGNCP